MTNNPRPSQDRGFTLTELLVVVVILALLAAIAVPTLTKDDEEERFEKFVSKFMRDLQRQRYAAISTREDRVIEISGRSYQLMTVVSNVRTAMETREAPPNCLVANVTNESGLPENTGRTIPSVSAMASTKAVRFNGTGGAQVDVSGIEQNLAATIYFATDSGKHKKRIVIFPATAYAGVFQDW